MRSRSPARPVPMTLHAAVHHRSMERDPHPPSSVSYGIMVTSPCVEAKVLMPQRDFINIHSHYAPISHHLTPKVIETSEVMRTYDFSQINTSHPIGFNPQQRQKRISKPPRKNSDSDLEKLPPMGPGLAKEIEKKKQVLEQAAIYAQIREKEEAETEVKRRTKTARRHPMPPFVLRIDERHINATTNLQDPLTAQPAQATPPAPSQGMRQSPVDPSAALREAEGHPPLQPHVKWAPNLMQQRQQKSQAPCAQRPPPRPTLGRRRSSNGPSTLRTVHTSRREIVA